MNKKVKVKIAMILRDRKLRDIQRDTRRIVIQTNKIKNR